ncbi:MAG: L-serine ammonia-lyase, iron-sulfur-dependent, subunit alpha [Candidatus Hadarchaeaceae archaeon]
MGEYGKLKTRSLITKIFKKEIKTAIGCTEIATVGLASSLAFNAALDNLGKDFKPVGKIDVKKANRINSILLTVDPYLFKNAVNVGIPHTNGRRGIRLAAALGLFGNPSRGLQIFDSVSEKRLSLARELEECVQIKIKSKWERPDLYAEVKIKMKGAWGRARIQHEHDKVVLVESENGTLFKGLANERKGVEECKRAFRELTVVDFINYVAELPDEIKIIVQNGIKLVRNLSEEGLKKPLGMGVGYVLRNSSSDTKNLIKVRTASAIDARMFGSPFPSIVVAGSGNHGITTTVPIDVYAEKERADEDLLSRSVALSYLVAIYVTYHSNYLSSICGLGFKAGAGSSAGLAYYMSKGDRKVVKRAIQNLIANALVMICDGGKYSCALKGATAGDAIYQSALLALKNEEPPHKNGMLGKTVEESIIDLGKFVRRMQPLNKIIVRKLFDKQV